MSVLRPRFWVALFAAAGALGAGVAVSVTQDDWSFFGRSGAVVVIVGAVVAAYDSLRAGSNPFLLLRRILSQDRLPSETLGLALMVLGTLIWAFGDLVPSVSRF